MYLNLRHFFPVVNQGPYLSRNRDASAREDKPILESLLTDSQAAGLRFALQTTQLQADISCLTQPIYFLGGITGICR